MQTPVEIGITFDEDGTQYVVCYVLNNRSLVCLPVELIQAAQDVVGDIDIIWPLGVYAVFLPDGLSVVLYGTMDGETVHRGREFNLTLDPNRLGPEVRKAWEDLRDTPKDELKAQLETLVEETTASRHIYDALDMDALSLFNHALTSTAAQAYKIPSSRVSTRLYFTEVGDIVANVFVDGKPIDLTEDPYSSVVRQHRRELSAHKPN